MYYAGSVAYVCMLITRRRAPSRALWRPCSAGRDRARRDRGAGWRDGATTRRWSPSGASATPTAPKTKSPRLHLRSDTGSLRCRKHLNTRNFANIDVSRVLEGAGRGYGHPSWPLCEVAPGLVSYVVDIYGWNTCMSKPSER